MEGDIYGGQEFQVPLAKVSTDTMRVQTSASATSLGSGEYTEAPQGGSVRVSKVPKRRGMQGMSGACGMLGSEVLAAVRGWRGSGHQGTT